ncbi:hypothetical protein BLA29_011388 [Euroglyphus maynei]|uniref:Uncharacterized protein n=1 Tax=Euroglyphus maynei TaxID=6958 RepID=A0A1Y3B7J0_EURMA|nr:hypothetical protein BLA29_011388 [Euroglyphus maynei]
MPGQRLMFAIRYITDNLDEYWDNNVDKILSALPKNFMSHVSIVIILDENKDNLNSFLEMII